MVAPASCRVTDLVTLAQGFGDLLPSWQEPNTGSQISFKDVPSLGDGDSGNGDGHRICEPEIPFEQAFEAVAADYTYANSTSKLILSDLERYSQPSYPEPQYHRASVGHLLTDRVEEVLQQLLPILKRQATLSFAPTSGVDVWGLANPEDRSHQVIVTQWVRLPSKQALRYWDRLAAALSAWAATLPKHLAAIVHERIVVEVRPKRRDDGV